MGVLLQSSGRNFSVQLTEYVVQLVNAQQLLLMFNSNFSKKMLWYFIYLIFIKNALISWTENTNSL